MDSLHVRAKLPSTLGILVLLMLLNLGACYPGRSLTPRFDFRTPDPLINDWLKAPIVAVGTVTSIAKRGGATMPGPGGLLRLRLFEMTIHVENVIRGEIHEQSIHAFRYGHESGHLPGNIPVNDIWPNERRVFFLMAEGHDYRLIEDVVDGSFWVASGAHPELDSRKPVFQQIAEVLLLPGDGFDQDQYARFVNVQSSRVLAMLGFQKTAALLNQVIDRAPKKVAAEACMALYTILPFGDDCAERLWQNPATPESLRSQVLEFLTSYGGGKLKERLAFKERPEVWFNSWTAHAKGMVYATTTYKEDLVFVLRQFLVPGGDPIIQRNAQALIMKYITTN